MSDDDLEHVREALAWLTEHAEQIPQHRRRHAIALLERVERMATTTATDPAESVR